MNSSRRSFVVIIKIPFTNSSCLRRSEILYWFYFETFTFTCCFTRLLMLCIRLSRNLETYNKTILLQWCVQTPEHIDGRGVEIFLENICICKKKKNWSWYVLFVYLPSLREHVNLSVPVAITPQCTLFTAFTRVFNKKPVFQTKIVTITTTVYD